MNAASPFHVFPFAPGIKPDADDDAPHLEQTSAEIMAEIFDELDLAIFVIAHSGRLVYNNLQGQRLLDQKNLLIRVAGKITVPDPEQRRQWHQSFFSAMAGSRNLVYLRNRRETVAIALSRIAAREEPGMPSHVLATTGRRARSEPWAIRAFAERHRLTPAEHRVLCRLQLGHSAQQIAHDLRLTESTIRTQIKSLLRKVGAQGIKSLLLRVTSLPPVGTEQWSPFTSQSAVSGSARSVFPAYRYTRRARGLSSNG